MNLKYILLIRKVCFFSAFFFPVVFLSQTITNQMFFYTGATQTFVVPTCAGSMTIELKGASGGTSTSAGGAGGCLTVVITPTPGQIMYLNVGGQGSVTTGGFNGGGPGGLGLGGSGSGGGGASDVRIGGNTLADRRFVAAGGGGSGYSTFLNALGGAGGSNSVNCTTLIGAGGAAGTGSLSGIAGGCAGGTGNQTGGGGGLMSPGGSASWGSGSQGGAGSLGTGGGGGNSAATYGGSGGLLGGGGGGGGYYGGGGGMSMLLPSTGCGGGGGSSYLDILLSETYAISSNWIGHGQIQISYSDIGSSISVSSPSLATCNSASTSLNAAGAITYTWAPIGSFIGSNSPSVVISPSVSTSYTVTGTTTMGCLSQSIISINVYTALPMLSVTVSPGMTVCPNQPLTFTVLDQTSPAVSTFSWTGITGPPFIFTNGGVFPVTISATNGCGTGSNSLVFNVISLTVTVQPSSPSICVGGSITLLANSPYPTTSYTWQPLNFIGSATTVSPITTTIYTVSVRSGSCVGSSTVQLTVNPNPTLVVTPAAPVICSGQQTNLFVTGANSYTWAVGNQTTSSISVNPIQSITYSVSGSLGTCSSSVSIPITVSQNPTVIVTAVPPVICSGYTANLLATGANNYIWSHNNQMIQGVSVNPLQTTTYTVTGSLGTCSSIATIQLSVNPNPTVTVVSVQTLVCKGNQATLTAIGADSYTWSTGDLSTVSIALMNSASVFSVIGSYSATGCSVLQTASVNVYAPPTLSVSPGATICLGSPVTLSAFGADNASYNWSTGQSLQNISVSPSVQTTYTVSALSTSNTISCPVTGSVIVSVKSLPQVIIHSSDTVVCLGNPPIIIMASGALTYSWSNSPVTANSIAVTPTSTTTYSVEGIGDNGCSKQVSLQIEVSPCITVPELKSENKDLIVYPNPNNGSFFIHSEKNYHIRIVDVLGKDVRIFELNEHNNWHVLINDLNTGVYFLVDSEAMSHTVQKIVINR